MPSACQIWRFVSAFLIGLAPTIGVAAEPFDFRGARLGMSLTEFKKLPFPGGKNRKPPSLNCTGGKAEKDAMMDGTSRIEVSKEERRIGVLRCAWLEPVYPSVWRRASMLVGGWRTDDVTYAFIKSPKDTDHRLYDIFVYITNDAFPDLVAGLTDRFGKPTQVESGEIRNKVGTRFPNAKMTWTNDVSSILFIERYDRIDEALLFYSHVALKGHYLTEIKKVTASPGSKL